LTLLAYAADERWAFVREGDGTLLLRPPYDRDIAALDVDVERAVAEHGYTVSDRSFATRQELLDFLSDESVRVWREHNPSIHPDVLRKRLLDVLAAEDIDRHIARAQEKIDAGAAPEALAMLGLLGSAAALSPGQRRRLDELIATETTRR
jgi:hypothetical protein